MKTFIEYDYLAFGVGSTKVGLYYCYIRNYVIIFVHATVGETIMNINSIFGRQEKAAETAQKRKSKQSALKIQIPWLTDC